MSNDSKAADDCSEYAIPTDAEMLARHNANEIRKIKHLLGILHNEVLDITHKANARDKKVDEVAKTTMLVDAKQCEIVHRVVELKEALEETTMLADAKQCEIVHRVVGLEEKDVQKQLRLDKHGSFLNILKTKEETKEEAK